MSKANIDKLDADIAIAGHEYNVGHILKAERIEKGVTLEDVSEEIKVAINYLRYIESNELEKIPGKVYLRGYLKSYAKYLNIESKIDIEAILNPNAKLHAQSHDEKSESEASQEGGTNNVLVAALVVILIAGVTVYYFMNQDGQADHHADSVVEMNQLLQKENSDSDDLVEHTELATQLLTNAPVQMAEPVQIDVSVEESDTENNDEVSEDTTIDESIETSTVVLVPENSDLALPIEKPIKRTTTQQVAVDTSFSDEKAIDDDQHLDKMKYPLTISFTDECWIEVRDGRGKTVLADLKRPGYVFENLVLPPISILAGAANAIEVTYNGESVDVAAFTSKNIAKIKLSKP